MPCALCRHGNNMRFFPPSESGKLRTGVPFQKLTTLKLRDDLRLGLEAYGEDGMWVAPKFAPAEPKPKKGSKAKALPTVPPWEALQTTPKAKTTEPKPTVKAPVQAKTKELPVKRKLTFAVEKQPLPQQPQTVQTAQQQTTSSAWTSQTLGHIVRTKLILPKRMPKQPPNVAADSAAAADSVVARALRARSISAWRQQNIQHVPQEASSSEAMVIVAAPIDHQKYRARMGQQRRNEIETLVVLSNNPQKLRYNSILTKAFGIDATQAALVHDYVLNLRDFDINAEPHLLPGWSAQDAPTTMTALQTVSECLEGGIMTAYLKLLCTKQHALGMRDHWCIDSDLGATLERIFLLATNADLQELGRGGHVAQYLHDFAHGPDADLEGDALFAIEQMTAICGDVRERNIKVLTAPVNINRNHWIVFKFDMTRPDVCTITGVDPSQYGIRLGEQIYVERCQRIAHYFGTYFLSAGLISAYQIEFPQLLKKGGPAEDLPLQLDGISCGVYTLAYASFWIRKNRLPTTADFGSRTDHIALRLAVLHAFMPRIEIKPLAGVRPAALQFASKPKQTKQEPAPAPASCASAMSVDTATKDNSAAVAAHRPDMTPLTEDENQTVDAIFQDASRRTVAQGNNLVIESAHMQCLRPGAWLNDEVMNYHIELMREKNERDIDSATDSEHKPPKCHFFNTQFYALLAETSTGFTYAKVQRWTRRLKETLLDKDLVFVPIHAGKHKDHWCLAVIDVKNKRIRYWDSMSGKDRGVLEVRTTLTQYRPQPL